MDGRESQVSHEHTRNDRSGRVFVGNAVGQFVRNRSVRPNFAGNSDNHPVSQDLLMRGDNSSTARPWRNTRTVPDVCDTTIASALVWRVMPAAAM
jgi:hypothetical protein